MPSKKPFIFSYNTGNDNTAVHHDAPCPVKDVPIYFAIIDGNLYVGKSIARRLYGNAIAGNYLRGKVKKDEEFTITTPPEHRAKNLRPQETYVPIRYVISAIATRKEKLEGAQGIINWLQSVLYEVVRYHPNTPVAITAKGDEKKAREAREGKYKHVAFRVDNPTRYVTRTNGASPKLFVRFFHDGKGKVFVAPTDIARIAGYAPATFQNKIRSSKYRARLTAHRFDEAISPLGGTRKLNAIEIRDILEFLETHDEAPGTSHKHAIEWLNTAFDTFKKDYLIPDEIQPAPEPLKPEHVHIPEPAPRVVINKEKKVEEPPAEPATDEPVELATDKVEPTEPAKVTKEAKAEISKATKAKSSKKPSSDGEPCGGKKSCGTKGDCPGKGKHQATNADMSEADVEAMCDTLAKLFEGSRSGKPTNESAGEFRDRLVNLIDMVTVTCIAASSKDVPASVHQELLAMLAPAHNALRKLNTYSKA